MEKRLRSLLARCPEWNDPAERRRLAAQLEADEEASGLCSGAVQLLRSHSSAHMRKRAMLRLANCWRYRSDCWTCRGGGARGPPVAEVVADANRPRKRLMPDDDGAAEDESKRLAVYAAPAGRASPQQTTLPLDNDRVFVGHRAAQSRVLAVMEPHLTAAARAWTGPHSAVQYGRARGEGMTWLKVRSIEGALEVTLWLGSLCRLRLNALRAWRDTLSPELLRSAAYYSDTAFNSPESELEALRYIMCQARASTHTAAQAQLEAMGVLRAQDAAWVADFDIGGNNAMAMIGAAHAFIAAQRMESLHAYVEAAEAVLGGIVRYCEESEATLRHRHIWTSEAAAAQGPAAGLRSEAQARVPPLVQRLRLTDDCEHGVALLALARTPPPRGFPPQRFAITTHAA